MQTCVHVLSSGSADCRVAHVGVKRNDAVV